VTVSDDENVKKASIRQPEPSGSGAKPSIPLWDGGLLNQ
jgi:hypothetical protein